MARTESHTFPKVAERWLASSAGTMSPKTIDYYRWMLENYVYPRMGESLVISELDVRNLLDKMRSEGFSEGTMYPIPKLIWRILSYASAEGLCKAPNWVIETGTPKKIKVDVVLTFDQEKKVISYLIENPGPKHLALYLMLTTGMSTGEVMSLTWADVSLYQKRIRVPMEDDVDSSGKDKHRLIPINEQQRIYLKKMQSAPSVYLATGKKKKVWAGALNPILKRMTRELHLPAMTPLDLRRTFAVHCLENGMSYEQLAKKLGLKNDRNFRASYRELVSPETRERLEEELLAARKPRQAPEHTNCIGPDLSPEVVALRQKVEAKKQQLNETLASLEGDLEIVHTLRRSNLAGLGRPREGLYQFIEKVLGDDRDGKMLVEYLRCNMRVADMPSQKDVCVQTIRSRVARGFAKLIKRLDAIYEVEGYDVLGMFHSLTARIQELAPPPPKRPGRKQKPTLENEYKQAMEALARIHIKDGNNTETASP